MLAFSSSRLMLRMILLLSISCNVASFVKLVFFELTRQESVAKLPLAGSLLGLVSAYYIHRKKSIRRSSKRLAENPLPFYDFSQQEAAPMKRPESGLGEDFPTSQNNGPVFPKNGADCQNSTTLYQKCIDCPDYGSTCNGPKLAAMEDIMTVRAFHRKIRDTRGIPMKLVYLSAQPISESTINDYFSHSEKDFKWTTVACIDNGLTAICGNRVGKPPLDHPCPASSTDIQDQMGLLSSQIEVLRTENSALQVKLTETKGRIITTREEVKEDYASRVQFLKELCDKRQSDLDAMDTKHQKEIARMDAINADYLARIDEKNRRLDRLSKSLRWMGILLAAAIVIISCYVVWDLVHPDMGFLKW